MECTITTSLLRESTSRKVRGSRDSMLSCVVSTSLILKKPVTTARFETFSLFSPILPYLYLLTFSLHSPSFYYLRSSRYFNECVRFNCLTRRQVRAKRRMGRERTGRRKITVRVMNTEPRIVFISKSNV